MQILNGTGVFGGIAIGKLEFFKRRAVNAEKRLVSDSEKEVLRFRAAKQKALDELHGLYEKTVREVGEDEAQIFDVHGMMTEDEDYNDMILQMIQNEKVNAEYAVKITGENFAAVFSDMEDAYMNARAADVRDVSSRILKLLSGIGAEASGDVSGEGVILCADDLSPSETMLIDRSRILAFVTFHGSVNSHTAILARSMGIPAVVGTGNISIESDGVIAAVDGSSGSVYIDPDERTMHRVKRKKEADIKAKELLKSYRGLDNVTRDGRRILVYANIQGPGEIENVLSNDAGGIGLFRSEFLYLKRNSYPSEEEQLETYSTVLKRMQGKKVIIRTLDIGADKKIGYFNLPEEENPALGMRAIRICLTRPEIFRTQLRALYRASVYGKLAIMFPMITSVGEVTEIMKITASVRNELRSEGISFSADVETGIMIETPAAALISDELAPLVDFFSVGTNDLSQYTMAIDRQNQSLSRFFDPHHKAVLKLIEMAAQNAHRFGKWIGVCGELGADLTLTEVFLRMGIDELSVSPAYVLELREKIRNTSLS